MSDAEPNWGLYRVFLAVAQKGSLSAAARHVGMSQPTLGRQIELLETNLGAKLFVRSHHGYELTEIGRYLVPHAEAMAAAAGALKRSSARRDEKTGVVRITAGAQLGVEVLPLLFAAFVNAHPRVSLELSISSESEDILRRDADIAVRMVRPLQKTVVARHIGKAKVGLFAHRSYIHNYGQPQALGELSRHRLIGFDREWQRMRLAGAPIALRREEFLLRSDNVLAQIALIRAGAGIGACHVNIARRDQNLLPVLSKVFALNRDVWLVVHPDVGKNYLVRSVFDHLGRGLKKHLSAN
jgi:DNA-binding transcriptional LysR family regulator